MTQDLPTGPSQPTDYDRVRAHEDARREAQHRLHLATVAAMEKEADGNWSISQAISLKRIADSLDYIVTRHQRGEL